MTRAPVGFKQTGEASWYGQDFHGKPTASGEPYDMWAHTAAHRELPFGSVVRVTHLGTGANTVVRINDRGPFAHGRIIDLSLAAARDLGLDRAGVGRVRIEVIGGDADGGPVRHLLPAPRFVREPCQRRYPARPAARRGLSRRTCASGPGVTRVVIRNLECRRPPTASPPNSPHRGFPTALRRLQN